MLSFSKFRYTSSFRNASSSIFSRLWNPDLPNSVAISRLFSFLLLNCSRRQATSMQSPSWSFAVYNIFPLTHSKDYSILSSNNRDGMSSSVISKLKLFKSTLDNGLSVRPHPYLLASYMPNIDHLSHHYNSAFAAVLYDEYWVAFFCISLTWQVEVKLATAPWSAIKSVLKALFLNAALNFHKWWFAKADITRAVLLFFFLVVFTCNLSMLRYASNSVAFASLSEMLLWLMWCFLPFALQTRLKQSGASRVSLFCFVHVRHFSSCAFSNGLYLP